MAKSTMDFAQHNTERAMEAANWVHAIAERNLNQSNATFEGLLTVSRTALRSIDQQSSAICEYSMAVAEQTLSNTFDFAHRVIRMRDPQELAQIQSEFVSRQAQVLGDQTKELGQRMTHGAQDIAKATQEAAAESRRRSEAA
jgi:hypothetical protein